MAFALILLVLFATTAGPACAQASSGGQEEAGDVASWEEVQRMIGDGRGQSALESVLEILERARREGDSAELTRALVSATQLRLELEGYETAVRELRAAEWPDEIPLRAALDLAYAETLVYYVRVHGWQVRQRERVVSRETVDLEAWTQEQIVAEAHAAFHRVWRERGEWGTADAGEDTVALGNLLDANTYPERIRGTLRDRVTYLWAELLEDSSLWTPRESNAVTRVDLDRLLDPEGAALRTVGLFPEDASAEPGDSPPSQRPPETDEVDHPLLRAAAVLADLERWHRRGGRPEAAMEAARVRFETVRGALSASGALQRRVREAWAERVASFDRELPWWSMAAHTLAVMEREEARRDEDGGATLVDAHATASAAVAAHPDSHGGRSARALLQRIEAPSVRVEGMAADGPGRRSFEVHHRNLGQIEFRAWKVDLRERLETRDGRHLFFDRDDVRDIADGRKPDARWTSELPRTPDYREHRTFVEPQMAELGFYLVRASAAGPAGQAWHVDFPFLVTDLVLVSREVDASGGTGPEAAAMELQERRPGRDDDRLQRRRALEVRVLRGDSGEPVSGATVDLYQRVQRGRNRSLQPTVSKVSDQEGRALFGPGDEGALESRFVTPVVSHEGSFAFDAGGLRLEPANLVEQSTGVLLYTDRGVYRPGQTVHWKAVAFRGFGLTGAYRTLSDAELEVALTDANGDEVETSTVTTNSFGSASGTFTAEPGRLLGGWSLGATMESPGRVGSTWIRVEEYQRPTFEVTVEEPEQELRLGREAELRGRARYYFGLPVTDASVRWRVSREPVFPWWWSWRRGGGRTEIVATGEAAVDADGRFRMRFTPEEDETLASDSGEVSWRYRLSADVTDQGGETRSAERRFHLGLVAVRTTLEPPAAFLRAELLGERAGDGAQQQTTWTLTRTDLDGAPRPGSATWELLRLDQPERALLPAEQPRFDGEPDGDREGHRTEGDLLRPRQDPGYEPERILRSWPDGAVLARGSVEHGEDGVATLDLRELRESARAALRAGAYRLRYRTMDSFGAAFETQREFVVTGDGGGSVALPALLEVERSSVAVGKTARVLVHSGLDGRPLELALHRDGVRVGLIRVPPSEGPSVVGIPVTRDLRGGFGVSLTVVADHQVMSLQERVSVPWDDRELEISFQTFRNRLRPGERETWRVEVRGPEGAALEAGAAEVLASMFDRSLEIFAPYDPPDVLGLYPDRGWIDRASTSIGALRIVSREGQLGSPTVEVPRLEPDRLVFAVRGDGTGVRRRFEVYRRLADLGSVERSQVAEETITVTSETPMIEERKLQQGAQVTQGELEKIPTARDPWAAVAVPDTAIRSDFSETAFWEPHLVLGSGDAGEGAVAFEFTVPDSVTDWNVWVHAVTRDLRGGSLRRQTRTVKELQVRPALPRFLREGDRAELVTLVDNTGEEALSGEVRFGIEDPDTGDSLLADFGLDRGDAVRPFRVEPGESASVSFPVIAPSRIGPVAFRVTARAGDLADGELRPLPVLPGRYHLRQSRFTALRDAEKAELHFADLAEDRDPTRIDQQLVVTLDGQLFQGVLAAVPYLVEYPYECTEQTLNRFLSTGILSSLFERYPAVSAMAERLAQRDTRLERFDEPDANREGAGMLLEETPWLQESRGGADDPERLIPVLDPQVAAAQRRASFAKLVEAQSGDGGFPWWGGGPSSPYLTLYVLDGLSRALEFEVELPVDELRPVVQRAWSYLDRHWLREIEPRLEEDCCAPLVIYLSHVLSSYAEVAQAEGETLERWTGGVFDEARRQRMLDHSFEHWRERSRRLKAMLALALHRDGRGDDARLLVDSVMDSAVTDPELGTHWAREERSWLWHRDTVESHAFILRVLDEIDPDDERRQGLVHWLFLEKKLSHWKSTRATAEAIYALVHYLRGEGRLGVEERAEVRVADERWDFVWSPDEFEGRRQIVVGPESLDTAEEDRAHATVTVEKDTPGLLFASATWHFSTEKLPAEATGDFFELERRLFRRTVTTDGARLVPLEEGAVLEPGDEVEVQLTLRADHAAEYVHLRDPRAAGFEPVALRSGWQWADGVARYEEVRDSGTNFFIERLPVGEVTLRYRLRADTAGTFKVAPATVQSMYAPEFTAYSSGTLVEIEP